MFVIKVQNTRGNQIPVGPRLESRCTCSLYQSDFEDDFRSGCRKLMSVNNDSSFQNYPHPDNHKIRTTDTPGFKPFPCAMCYFCY